MKNIERGSQLSLTPPTVVQEGREVGERVGKFIARSIPQSSWVSVPQNLLHRLTTLSMATRAVQTTITTVFFFFFFFFIFFFFEWTLLKLW